MSQTIAFNADERMKILSDALAKRLGYSNLSEMLRDWVEKEIAENIPPEEQEQIVALYKPRKPGNVLREFHKDEGGKRPFARSRRQAKK